MTKDRITYFVPAHWSPLEFIVSPKKVVGCRGGNWYFEGVRGFLEIPKVQKVDFYKYQESTRTKKSKNLIFHKYQESTRASVFGQMICDSLKNIFDSLGFAYDFAFCRNNGSLRISKTYSRKSPSKTLRDTIFFGGGRGS